MKNKIDLGDKIKDPVTGIVGIAVARTTWLHGCDRITLQPQGHDKEHKPFEAFTVDEPQLILVSPKKVKRGRTDTGGPRPEITSRKYGINNPIRK